MRCQRTSVPGGPEVDLITVQTLIIGSGAAGLNCAEHLHELGISDIAVATDELGAGTSNNSGSDKQTYYKIGIFGEVPDSPIEFAHSLYDGGMMHGDLAYVEALGSAPEFFHLVRNGVAFPYNRYGAYVGYKTDHDPRQRATSAGPRTSMQMFEKSLANVRRNGTRVLDGHEVIALLTAGEGEDKRVVGAVALNLDRTDAQDHGLVLFNCENVVMATGGPGEMYETTVYPEGQIGSHGLALAAGAVANNLGESQYGLASTSFRWNLSGTYQQVIPCYYSTAPGGGEERYFLNDYFHTMEQVASNIFLKGYQWPFHASRLQDYGSSIVDYAVAQEIRADRQVWMDFTRNPVPGEGMEEFDLENLSEEARGYLERSGATHPTPLARLQHMNPLSVDIYADNGIDLASEPIPVAVCAQHNNGGLRGDAWWESNLAHLFPIGEVNGSHGVRPGGSALNSGQVGGRRAAQYIANVHNDSPMEPERFLRTCSSQVQEKLANVQRHLDAGSAAPTNEEVRSEIKHRMSMHGAFLRSTGGVQEALAGARRLRDTIAKQGIRIETKADLNSAFQNQHLCLTHIAFLETIRAYIERGGGSRGGYLIQDAEGELSVETKKGTELPHRPENMEMREEIIETVLGQDGEFEVRPVERRPLPEDESWYETTWDEWRKGRIFEK
jgi:succinate dehydrogenase/fumarate reductase flavoprotein subunit